jgi:hypothetical protein
MAGAQAQAQIPPNPPPPTNWQCDVCNAGPYLYKNTTRCSCNHDFNHACCKKDNDIPLPLTSPQSSLPGAGATRSKPKSQTGVNGAISVNHHHPVTTPPQKRPRQLHRSRSAPKPTRTHQSLLPNNDVQCGSRPSMRGWWTCCQCNQMNNPDLATGRCWNCQHPGPCPGCILH